MFERINHAVARTAVKAACLLAVTVCLVFPLAAQDFGEYRIGPKDLLDIKVLEAPELNGERRVADSGTISLPMLGEVSVSGLTVPEVRDRISALLTARFVQRANVTVSIKELANKPITVIGAVARPGALNISGRYHLLQVISAAGGLSANAGRIIYILRNGENGLNDTLEVRTVDLFESANPMWNVPIAASDVINIPAQSAVKIFCLGEVKSPGQLTFDSGDRITLLTVIARAGGLTDRASNTVKIKRRNSDGKESEITANYKAILKGKVPDLELESDDVLIVGEAFF